MFYNLLLISLLVFVGVFVFISGFYGAPSVPTPKKAAKKMVQLMEVKKGRIYYDLGSGDGRILKEVAKKGALAIGFELNPLTYLYSKIILLSRGDKKIRIYWKDFWKTKLKVPSGIFCYLLPQPMERLEKKFKQELKSGTKVVSYAFKLPGKQPEKIVKMKKYAPIYLYRF